MKRQSRYDEWWGQRVAIVTGASSGIGRATTLALLQQGCRVAMIARSADRLADLAESRAERALVLVADVRDREVLQQQILTAIQHWGRVDLLVYSAGVLTIGICDEFDDSLRAMIETNTLGAAWATRAVVPTMRRQRFGRIVYVGSVSGYIAPVGYAGYSMSKWGLQALAQSVRCELRPSNVRVSVVSPYYVRTPMLEDELTAGPLPGFNPKAILEPEMVAQAILRAARTGQREVILAPWTVRAGLVLGRFLPAIQDAVMSRLGRALVEHRSRARADAPLRGVDQVTSEE
jgi:NAD(P)-dependent dehydrogenase (short-subunit alcohol dehydrogenase family)